ncbi:MAG TPA: VOC family protein [Candidatus Saccharimonadales bacterium]|nr:VOC family protein [Candidatus Saccharimonadales bacterium]
MLNFSSLMIGTHDPKKLSEFYKKVFDKKPDMQDGSWYGWMVGNTFFSIGEHSEVKGKSKEPQRQIFNLETNEVEEEFARVKKAGATVIKAPYEMGGAMIATLADPDGNYFQLMTPWSDGKN